MMMRGVGLAGLIAFMLVGLAQVARVAPLQQDGAHNVILFLGDGLGPTQMTLGIRYAREVGDRRLHMESLMEAGNTGYALPFPYESIVIDSSAAATQITAGTLARNETAGVDSDGNAIETILEWAEGRGLATGLVTTTRLTHGTLAGVATHVVSRYTPEQVLADQILGGHDIEVLLGGGARAFVPSGERVSMSLPGVPSQLDGDSVRADDRNWIDVARSRGYAVASDRDSLRAEASSSMKLFGLFSSDHQPYVVDRRAENLQTTPGLAEMTEAALQVLARNERGFFMMVEGGRIDHAAHSNDAGTMLHEILDFDEAVGVGSRFQREHPNTLVIVTADHSTGGFSFTYSPSRGYEERLASGDVYDPQWYYPGESELRLLGNQTRSFARILQSAGLDPEKLQEEVRSATGLSLTLEDATRALARNAEGDAEPHDFREFYAEPASAAQALLARALARQTSVVWSTGGHTSDPVLTFGIGPGAEELRGVYLNTHLYGVMKRSLEAAE